MFEHITTLEECDEIYDQLKKAHKRIVDQIPYEWAICKRWLKDQEWHGGSCHKGFIRYLTGRPNWQALGARNIDDPNIIWHKTKRSAEEKLEYYIEQQPSYTQRLIGNVYVFELVRRDKK